MLAIYLRIRNRARCPLGAYKSRAKHCANCCSRLPNRWHCQTIIDWIGRTASALSAARQAGIVHRISNLRISWYVPTGL